MLFNSFEFILVFLPLVLSGFHLLRARSAAAAEWWLTGASFLFYAWWNPKYLILLVATIGVNYGLGLKLMNLHRTGRPSNAWFAIGVFLNLGSLAYFKYANFFVDNMNAVLGTSFNFEHVFLPLAISFITFQKIAFLADARAGRVPNLRLRTFALFAAFFPQLIAGPIVVYDEVYTQLDNPRRCRRMWLDISAGLTMFGLGLVKKVGIADFMADHADYAFAAAGKGIPLTFMEAWSAVICFTFQIYFDFSGYSDMAAGLARMFGVRLPLNFNSPYQATSIIDFWHRWHISLSRFLREHLYIPLGGNRLGPARRHLNLMITMALGGLWHGANWTFLVWGTLHGIYLTFNHMARTFLRGRLQIPKPLGWLVTVLAVMVAWVFFRAESFPAAWSILAGMVGAHGIVLPQTYEPMLGRAASWIGVSFGDTPLWDGRAILQWQIVIWVIVALLPNSARIMSRYRLFLTERRTHILPLPRWMSWRANPRGWIIALILWVLGALLLIQGRANDFIYFQF